MFDESPVPAFDRLSANDRKILSQPEIRGVLSGIKPAAFEDWHGTIQDLHAVRDVLSSVGIDALVTPRIIMNRKTVARRIADEPELARRAGWKDGESVDSLAEKFERLGTASENDVLRGFLVGFPASAILGFQRKEELGTQGVQTSPTDFFNPKFADHNPSATINDESRSRLASLAAEYAGLPRLKWEQGPDRPSAETVDALLNRRREEISALYQSLWNLSKQDADTLAWRKTVTIKDANGGNLCEFSTFGKDGDTAPDVLALQEMARNVKSPF